MLEFRLWLGCLDHDLLGENGGIGIQDGLLRENELGMCLKNRVGYVFKE
jgi:hypothetical protein